MPRGLARGLACCWLALGAAPAAAEAAATLSPALQEAAAQAEANEAVQGIVDMDCWEKLVTYEPLDMKNGHGTINVTKEPTPLACQQRCEQTSGCLHFAYWVLQGDCHLQDVFAIRQTNRVGFVSGPKRCYRDDEEALSHGMARLTCKGVGDYTFVPVEHSCLEVSTRYSSFMNVPQPVSNVAPADQDPIEAMTRCQQLCRDTEGCAHFTIGQPGLECGLAGAQSPAVFPIFKHVSGPPDNCTELLYQKLGSPTQTTTTLATTLPGGQGVPGATNIGNTGPDGSGAPTWLWGVVALLGLCCLAAVLAALGMKKTKYPRSSVIEGIKDDSGSDDFHHHHRDEEPEPHVVSAPAKLPSPVPGPLRPMLTALTPWFPLYWQRPQYRYTPVPSTESAMNAFDAIDRNHDGVIDRDEFNKALARSPRASTYAVPRAATYVTIPPAPTFVASPRAPPMASVQVTGPDLNRNGIPDALERPGPLAQAFSVSLARQPQLRQPPPQPARMPSAPHIPHAPPAPARLVQQAREPRVSVAARGGLR